GGEGSARRPGGGEGLRRGGGEGEPRPARQQGQRARGARAGELGVRLVDHDQAGGRVVDLLDEFNRHRGTGGVVRRGDEHHVGLPVPHLLGRGGQAVGGV